MIVCDDVLHWAETYQGEPAHAIQDFTTPDTEGQRLAAELQRSLVQAKKA